MTNASDSRRASLPHEVQIGGMSTAELRSALGDRHVQLNRAAELLFQDPRFTTLPERRTVAIVALKVADLGFDAGSNYEQLVARALAEGYAECPLELGPHLRLQFVNQPDSADGLPMTHGRAPPGSITVASAALDDLDETPKGFYLRQVDGVLWLRGYWSWPGHVWSPDDVLVFSKQ
jgi:hypothetical protein